jgi:hypothetical protein
VEDGSRTDASRVGMWGTRTDFFENSHEYFDYCMALQSFRDPTPFLVFYLRSFGLALTGRQHLTSGRNLAGAEHGCVICRKTVSHV